MRSSPQLYSRMEDSVGPSVFGNTEVKRGILLMLLGGGGRGRVYEAMEQLSVSISQATLNARTSISILAAANPVYGCYDRT